jgi:hypothetical protein
VDGELSLEGGSLLSYLNRPQANTSALPLLTPVYPPEGFPLGALHTNYYMSHFSVNKNIRLLSRG